MTIIAEVAVVDGVISKRGGKGGRGERDLSPVPFPERKGRLLVGMTSDGVASILAGMVWLPLL